MSHEKERVFFYTMREEIANSITHGIGAVLSVIGVVVLIVLATIHGDGWRLVSFSVYGATLTILYLASTLYHSVRHARAKRILRIFDHAAIFLFIAGSYTPFLLVKFRGPLGWTLLVVVWLLALSGIAYKFFFLDRFPVAETAVCLLMGWLFVVLLEDMVARLPTEGLVWLMLGGVAYTVGVIFYAQNRLRYSHAIWHLFVLGGSVCHYFAIWTSLLPGTAVS